MNQNSEDGNKRIGVYVCRCGGNISEVVDTEKVVDSATKEHDVAVVRENDYMCSVAGQKRICDDIAELGLDRVVVAACSPHIHEKTFSRAIERVGLSPYVLEMANIRAQCSWVHPDDPEAATVKAKDLTSAAIAKARLDEPLERKTLPVGKSALVIGGGVAGIQAALDLGDAGFTVHLVEKEPSIGGKMVKLSRTFPTEDCAACILSPKMADVPANPNIKLYSYSEVESIEGYVGNFEVTVLKKPRYVDIDTCTACGVCAEKCPVKIKSSFEEGLTEQKSIYVPFSFAVPFKYLIDEESCLRLQRGGEVCGLCQKNCPHDAIDFREKPQRVKIKADTIVVATGYDIFDATEKKVYGYGRFENVITSLQLERIMVHASEGTPIRDIPRRIAFIQCVGSRDESINYDHCSRVCCMYAGKLSQLVKRADPKRDVYVFYKDIRAYGKGFEEYYKRAQDVGVKFVRGNVIEAYENDKTKKVTLKVEDTLSEQVIESEFDLVVLSVGSRPSQGTEKIAEILKLAKGAGGFLQEAHPKYQPVDTLREGVFLAGTVQGPKDIPDTVAQASAAALRAIRFMNQGEYALDPVMAFVHNELCDMCGRCVGACPVDAIAMASKAARVNQALCRGCGICIASCPTDALDLHCYTNDQLRAEVAAVLRDKPVDETRVLIFADDMTAFRLADAVGTARMPYPADTRIIRVPTGSRVTPGLMLHAFAQGADGILIAEREQKSSPYPLSLKTIENNVSVVRGILEEGGVTPERLEYGEFVSFMLTGFMKEVENMSEFTKKLGAIPDQVKKELGKDIPKRLFAGMRKESEKV